MDKKVIHFGVECSLSFEHDNESSPSVTSAIVKHNGTEFKRATVKRYYKDKCDKSKAEHFAFTKLLTICSETLSKSLYEAWAHS